MARAVQVDECCGFQSALPAFVKDTAPPGILLMSAPCRLIDFPQAEQLPRQISGAAFSQEASPSPIKGRNFNSSS
jgi:hypothetical protein